MRVRQLSRAIRYDNPYTQGFLVVTIVERGGAQYADVIVRNRAESAASDRCSSRVDRGMLSILFVLAGMLDAGAIFYLGAVCR